MVSTASHVAAAGGNHPVKVLFLASNPASTERLRIDREARLIRERLLAATHADRVQIVARWAVRLDDLLQALLEVQPHIVHFSGHGTRAQEILLEDGIGNDAPVSADALAGLFGVLKDRIRLVVLNACYSQQQAEAINQHIDVTIGMGRSVSDEAAVEFAATLYQAIGFGRSLQTAFDLARKVLECKRIPGSDIPQLFVRPGFRAREVVFVDGLGELGRPGSGRMTPPPSLVAPQQPRTPETVVVPVHAPNLVNAPVKMIEPVPVQAIGTGGGKAEPPPAEPPPVKHPAPELVALRPSLDRVYEVLPIQESAHAGPMLAMPKAPERSTLRHVASKPARDESPKAPPAQDSVRRGGAPVRIATPASPKPVPVLLKPAHAETTKGGRAGRPSPAAKSLPIFESRPAQLTRPVNLDAAPVTRCQLSPRPTTQRPHRILVATVMCLGLTAATCVRSHSPERRYSQASTAVKPEPTLPAEPQPVPTQSPASTNAKPLPPAPSTTTNAKPLPPAPSTTTNAKPLPPAPSTTTNAKPLPPAPSSTNNGEIKPGKVPRTDSDFVPVPQDEEFRKRPKPTSGSADCKPNGVCMLLASSGTFSARTYACLGPVGSGVMCKINQISEDGATAICDQPNRSEDKDVIPPNTWRQCSN